MRNFGVSSIATLLLLGASTVSAQEFGWFSQVVGACWKGTFPDGATVHKHCYTRQFQKFIRGTSELLTRKEGKEVQAFQGDSLFAWNAAARTIDYYIWGSDGSHRQLSAHFIDNELHFPVPSKLDPGKVLFRSVWTRVDDSTFEVRRERPAAEGWSTELRITYRREG